MIIECDSAHCFEGIDNSVRLHVVNADFKQMIDAMGDAEFNQIVYYAAIRKEREENETINTEFDTGHCSCDNCSCNRED